MFQTKVAEKIKTLLLCSVIFFPEYHVVYERMWKINVVSDRPQMAIRLKCIACWIPKATNTH